MPIASGSESRAEDIARELLSVRGWDTSRPPKGHLLRKNECRQVPLLRDALAGRGKKGGGGDGLPDFLIVDQKSMHPLLVIETKASEGSLDLAEKEARYYADAFSNIGPTPLASGIAGTDESHIGVRISKSSPQGWKSINYRNKPIHWLPTPDEASLLLNDKTLFDLEPEVPAQDVLAKKAEEINRILRECTIKDEFRPAVVAAFMLGLWKSQGEVRTHPEHILHDINQACQKAFEGVGKYDIAQTLRVPEENEKLQNRASQICYILRLLNVTTLTAAHDYLGQLYETFFRFTGGNTIGQYFTPRHIARFVADLTSVSRKDVVLDPTCGTGGFLIASLYRMIGNTNPSKRELTTLVQKHLLGFESEPTTAAMCVANMILRDRKSVV